MYFLQLEKYLVENINIYRKKVEKKIKKMNILQAGPSLETLDPALARTDRARP